MKRKETFRPKKSLSNSSVDLGDNRKKPKLKPVEKNKYRIQSNGNSDNDDEYTDLFDYYSEDEDDYEYEDEE